GSGARQRTGPASAQYRPLFAQLGRFEPVRNPYSPGHGFAFASPGRRPSQGPRRLHGQPPRSGGGRKPPSRNRASIGNRALRANPLVRQSRISAGPKDGPYQPGGTTRRTTARDASPFESGEGCVLRGLDRGSGLKPAAGRIGAAGLLPFEAIQCPFVTAVE